ncbi:MAG: DNA polymerase III subunit chi [Jannaschia sp.]
MGEVHFYHLTRNPVAAALGSLLPRCLDRGWRVAIRGTDPDRLRALDETLWLGPSDSFLPHGLAGGPHDADQPILLTTGPAANTPACLFCVDGADLASDDLAPLERACILFDGRDEEAVARARTHWTALTDAGAAARYWSEESGKWEQKASKNVAAPA